MQSLLLDASLLQASSPLLLDESPPQSPLSSLSSSVDWLLPHASVAPEQPSAAAPATSVLDALEFDDDGICCGGALGPEGGTSGGDVVDDGDDACPQVDA